MAKGNKGKKGAAKGGGVTLTQVGIVLAVAIAGSGIWSHLQTANQNFLLESWDRRCEACQVLMLNLEFIRQDVSQELNKAQVDVGDVYGTMCNASRLEKIARDGIVKYKNGFEVSKTHDKTEDVEFIKRTVELCSLLPTIIYTAAPADSERVRADTQDVDNRLRGLTDIMNEKLMNGSPPGWAGEPLDAWQQFERVWFGKACVLRSEICTDETLAATMFNFKNLKKVIAKFESLKTGFTAATEGWLQGKKDAAEKEEEEAKTAFMGAMGP